ncbi:MAG: efflux RND transporter periplasmic adaptor subunit, partial [Proteobacteria bacterium]|nr:efflux RND transporter periplasmic adaptor subunit [Pseudomonadota bacterium]
MSNEMTPRPTPDPQVMRQLGRESSWRLPQRAWFCGAGALGLAVIVAIFFWLRGDGPSYVTQEAVRGDLEVVVSATGTLRPRDQVDIGAEISGRIEKVLVDFNDRVVTGQILALLNTDQLEAKLAQSEAQFASARANVAQQEATLAQARATAARAEELFERSVLSQQELEAAQADLQRANANLRRANADAQLAAALVTADETNLSKASILSPIDGVVLDRRVEPGQAVAASFQTPILFTLASDLSQMELQIDLDEADIGVVHEGQHASFTVDAFPQRRFDANLVALHNAPETVNGVVTFPGVLAVDNNQRILRPGLTATVIILVADIIAILHAGKLLLVEPLDVLKDEIRELNITMTEDTTKLPAMGGKILHSRRHRHQWQLLVRGLGDGEIEALRGQSWVQELGIRTPSLEEIFVAYLKLDDRTESEPAP